MSTKRSFAVQVLAMMLLCLWMCAAGCRTGAKTVPDAKIVPLPDCNVGDVLKVGEGCKGSGYTLLNEGGTLNWGGAYFDSRSKAYRDGDNFRNGFLIGRGRFTSGDIALEKLEGNMWRIDSLPGYSVSKEARELIQLDWSKLVDCEVGLVLRPGDGCKGAGYALYNNDAGRLVAAGSYIESCSIDNDLMGMPAFELGFYMCDALILLLDRKDKTWTVVDLPGKN